MASQSDYSTDPVVKSSGDPVIDHSGQRELINLSDGDVEEWRLCQKVPRYEVSSTGRIRHRDTQTLVKPCQGNGVIVMVDLVVNPFDLQKLSVAHLVLEAFVERPTKKHFYAGFRDNNPKNLNRNNLYWSDTFVWPKS